MKLYLALTNIILGLPLLKAAAATPTLPETILGLRGDFDWPKCLQVGKESCTVYIATSDGSSRSKYRIATLYDSDCNKLQIFKTNPSNPKITLKGTLPEYVDLYVDDYYRPNGRLSYKGTDRQLEREQACYKFPGTDGLILELPS
ncbi:hypothetical protein DL764_005977 [Monosporascus ibericus]|uniref:Uncharacterized protein n=1 Tax=Monosporascus ibericus TaxID=155417 RepID=A0A4Q4T9Z9_9PEZI|nr:hypothetical protein DL764_005977 [Monosporascus ibericus]